VLPLSMSTNDDVTFAQELIQRMSCDEAAHAQQQPLSLYPALPLIMISFS
jgi:hypothetical protein